MRYRKVRPHRKVCIFCKNKSKFIDYKDVDLLKTMMTPVGKISTRRSTGTCAKHQRELARTIKKARSMALLPYTSD
ncbi:MAG: 30S ribosomal protein S18 [Erysipelotrichia bacterium]|nr:30S ribosomal protein S18 [Erysipelotrichia bacterium]